MVKLAMSTFSPKTDRLKKLAKIFPNRIQELEKLFQGKTRIYIDYANVYHWSKKIKWNLNIKRLKQFLDSFSNIEQISMYQGTLAGNSGSEGFIAECNKYHYRVVTKPVKIMNISMDVSGIPSDSPVVLNNFIKHNLIKQFKIETIEYLNNQLHELNNTGKTHLQVKKCNFDVEIGRDMLLDFERNGTESFILWSGDSDFAEPVEQLIKDKKHVVIFATARRVSVELSQTKAPIFDINKIKDFICMPKQITENTKKQL